MSLDSIYFYTGAILNKQIHHTRHSNKGLKVQTNIPT